MNNRIITFLNNTNKTREFDNLVLNNNKINNFVNYYRLLKCAFESVTITPNGEVLSTLDQLRNVEQESIELTTKKDINIVSLHDCVLVAPIENITTEYDTLVDNGLTIYYLHELIHYSFSTLFNEGEIVNKETAICRIDEHAKRIFDGKVVFLDGYDCIEEYLKLVVID